MPKFPFFFLRIAAFILLVAALSFPITADLPLPHAASSLSPFHTVHCLLDAARSLLSVHCCRSTFPSLLPSLVNPFCNSWIFCGVASKHTVTSEQSTFMMDLHQIGIMLRHATSRSLCLIDEFGKGTLTTDGIGLLCATLKHFASYKSPPKVLVCTHLSEIFNEYHLPKSESLKFYTMSILQPNNSVTIGVDDIIFLYRLVPGRAFSSYGLHCAKLAGVPFEILERAMYILSVTNDRKPFDRFQSESLLAKDKQYKEIMERFVAFDFMNGDVKDFLNNVFSLKSQLE